MTDNTIVVRSHVSRDLLQSAGLFKTDKLVVWEYVSNGLQYTDQGTSPVVDVTLDSKSRRIVITDQGRGMDFAGLQHFFVMHGENLDRKAGRRGRGRFGTGKSAAFGIADRLKVTSVRNGVRNTVELTREDIIQAGEDEIPVRFLEKGIPTADSNGTVIEISDIKIRKLDQRGVIRFVERHLARWPNRPTVLVNNHVCEFDEPPVASSRKAHPDSGTAQVIGDVELTLKVAKTPLDSELQGVAVFSSGTWLETTLAGCEGQAMSQYIFGEIDVPALDDDDSSIPAYDISRAMRLNSNNEVVISLIAFIGREVDKLRRELANEDKRRRAQEESKKLAKEASLIAQMINQDFLDFSQRLSKVKARAGKGRDYGLQEKSGEDGQDTLVDGGSIPASVIDPEGGPGHGDGHSRGGDTPPSRGPVLEQDEQGQPRARTAAGNGQMRKPRGGFDVEFRNMGSEAARALYDRAHRTIFINLDHPQIEAAQGKGNIENPNFRRLAYEVAFVEYAVALASEFADHDEYIEPSEPIFDIRETVNRMARRAAVLYAG